MPNKVKIKEKSFIKQNGKCAVSGKELATDVVLMDTHRPTPKRKGGTYTDKNSSVVDPVEHMKEHGTLRLRTGEDAMIKKLVDEREHAIRVVLKLENQLRAYKRGVDDLDPRTASFLEQQAKAAKDHQKIIDKDLKSQLKKLSKTDPLVLAMTKVRAIGPVTIAYCISYIDLTKARHASCLWSYAGLHKASHERYEKTVAGGGNKRLRTILYMMAESQMKAHGPYRVVYDNTKTRLEHSEKIVKTRNTQGKLIECAWKDTKPSHRHGAALRAVMKHFLADYWMVGRTLMGLPTSALYPEAILGGTHRTIMPEERGWEY